MKLIIYSLFLSAILFSCFEAKSFHTQEKRFLGSVGSWINNNIINPITDNVINPIVGGVTNVINTISDPLASFGNQFQNFLGTVDNFFSNTVSNAVTDAFNTIKDQTLNVVNMATNIIFPSGEQQGPAQDPCQTTCFQRINYQDQVTDYYFDRPNGCISKGHVDASVKMFDSCCDLHNTCLNSKCCTTECQSLKNQCDTEYNQCLKKKCVNYIDDDVQFYRCLAIGSYMGSTAVNRTCSATLTKNRKLCYC